MVPPLGRLYIRGHPPSIGACAAGVFAAAGADAAGVGVGFDGVWIGGTGGLVGV